MADRDWWIRAPTDIRGTRWLVAAAVLAAIAIVLRQPLLLSLAVVLGLVAGLARLWWRYGLSEVSYRRRLPTSRAVFGEEIELELIAENRKPLPLVWLEVVDEFPADLPVVGTQLEPSEKPRKAVFRMFLSVRPYERVRRRYRLRCVKRGLHRFGPARLTTGDPFGFAGRQIEIPTEDELVVYPRVVPVTVLGLPARQPLGDRRPAQPLVEDPLRPAGVRPYVAGDSPRRIHWRATARTGDVQTKRYEPTAREVIALFLDANTFEHFWEGVDPDLLELAIITTASLAAHTLDAGQQVGLYSNAPIGGSARFVRLPPSRHPAQLAHILEALARLIPATGTRIEATLAHEAPRLPWAATIVVVTGNVTAELQRTLLRLARGNRAIVLISCGDEPVLDPALVRRAVTRHIDGKEIWREIDQIALVY